MFDGLKARLDRLLRDRGADPRAYAASLREALVEARLGITEMRRALAATEAELEAERRQLADTERRGRLAAAVPDAETVAVAERFAARHRERILVLERGQLLEIGSHQELLARNGRYAELFHLQARGYQ